MTTKLEMKINGTENLTGKPVIDCVLSVLEGNKWIAHSAEVIGRSIAEVVDRLPPQCEIDTIATLSNYFNPSVIQKWSIEIENSQYIHYTHLPVLLDGWFYRYVRHMEKGEWDIVQMLDMQAAGE